MRIGLGEIVSAILRCTMMVGLGAKELHARLVASHHNSPYRGTQIVSMRKSRASGTVAFLTKVAAAALAVLISSTPAAAKKVALVIGNANYESVRPLGNPPLDARLVADTFETLGFEVLTGNDLDQVEFASLLAKFDNALEGAEAAAFYYAGHGIQFEGQNYLISTNASLENAFLLTSETILLDVIVDTMEAKSPVNMVFLDACRDNPFVARLQSKLPRSRSAATREGLAPAVGFGADTMIMYATASNAVALDGDGENSPFAKALIKHLRAPDTEIGLAMKRVIRDVREETAGQQSPEMLTSVSIELYLNLSIAISQNESASRESSEIDGDFAGMTESEANRQLEALWSEGLVLAHAGKDNDYYVTMDKAQKIASARFGEDSLQYAQANNHLIGALTGLQRIEDAIYSAREAIRVYEKLYGKESIQTAGDKANLASRLHTVGLHDEAESKWLESIRIYERANRRMGWDNVGYAVALEGLARFRADSGDHSAAGAMFGKAIDVMETSGNTRVINYGWLLANYGHFQRSQGNCDGSKESFRRAVQAFKDAGVSTSQGDHADALKRANASC